MWLCVLLLLRVRGLANRNAVLIFASNPCLAGTPLLAAFSESHLQQVPNACEFEILEKFAWFGKGGGGSGGLYEEGEGKSKGVLRGAPLGERLALPPWGSSEISPLE